MQDLKIASKVNNTGLWLHRFIPGLTIFLQYQRGNFRFDIIAGLSVAAVAMPVGIAYAEIAGVPVVYGIYSAMLPLLAYALFGSSRQLITGPDAATCIMVASALGPLAGGDSHRYMELMISLNGIALIILVGQLPKLFGYKSEARDFLEKLIEFIQKIEGTHMPTFIIGFTALAILIALKRWAPRLPGALIVTALGIIVVEALHLKSQGVAVLGTVPAGFPTFHVPTFDPLRLKMLVTHAAGIALISFTSGILTTKSFARRNRYDIDANQELIAFGACNIVTSFAQGFPVTGADSRTAVNNDMGGKTQLVGIVAAGVMMLFLLFFTAPLASLPNAALAAVIAIASIGLFDLASLRELYAASRRELAFSLVTTIGVLYFDVLPGVAIAIVMTLFWMLLSASKPHDAVLGRVPGISGFHDITDYPNATTPPGLLLYRFDGDILFFNVDYFKERIMSAIDKSPTPIERVIIDASPVNVVDITALHKLKDLRDELEKRGVLIIFARVKQSLWNIFNTGWVANQPVRNKEYWNNTMAFAVNAFEQSKRG